jgi:hypothetical protein
MQITELQMLVFGGWECSGCVVADYTPPSSKSKFPVGAVVGGVVGGLALSLAVVALFLFKPIAVFDPFRKNKIDCKPPLSLMLILLVISGLSYFALPSCAIT